MNIYIKEHDFDRMDFYGSIPTIGELVTLCKRENVLTGECSWSFASKNGASGNLDYNIKRFHGWRGTTNNIAVYAMGLRRVEKIKQFKNGNWIITLSRDLKSKEE